MIVDSTLWMEPYYVRVLFTSLLALKDADFIVHGDAFKIARRANMTEEEVMEGLKILMSPDTKRKEPQEHEGRRLEKVDGGYRILNAKKYRDMISKCQRKEYKRQWQYDKRHGGTPLDQEPEGVKAFARGDEEGYNAAVTP